MIKLNLSHVLLITISSLLIAGYAQELSDLQFDSESIFPTSGSQKAIV